MLQAIRRYQNRAIEAAQVIEELIQLAKAMRAANARREGSRAAARKCAMAHRPQEIRTSSTQPVAPAD
ncbi:MAG: DUF3387 domain-containing protein [candidate division KSB1 bacterium]|nr:DUF3387 domain-containing protein [candidate division KSB1 bacterium]